MPSTPTIVGWRYKMLAIMITCLGGIAALGLYSWATSLAQKQAQDSKTEADYEIRRGG